MKRTTGIALALSFSLFALPACTKDKKPEAEKVTPGDQDKDTSAEDNKDDIPAAAGKASKVALPPVTLSADLSAVLKHMPADTEILVSMNFASLRGTKLWEKMGPAALAKAGGGLDKATKACGLDPVAELQSAHFAINSSRSEEAVVIVKGLHREPIVKCVKAIAKLEKATLKVSEEGNFTTLKSEKDDNSQTLIWLDEATMLFVPGKLDKGYLQARYDGKNALSANADFIAYTAKANQKSPIWFAGSFGASSKATQGMASMGGQPKGLYGSMAFVDGVQIALGVTFVDESAANNTLQTAKAALGMAKSNLGEMASLVDKVQLSTVGADLSVTLDMSAKEVDMLSDMASAFTQK